MPEYSYAAISCGSAHPVLPEMDLPPFSSLLPVYTQLQRLCIDCRNAVRCSERPDPGTFQDPALPSLGCGRRG